MSGFEIPPGGIWLIRETRSENREEFAAEVGVTRHTIGNWERGDSTPREQYREEIKAAIPPELSLEEVQNAKSRFADTDGPRAYDIEQRLFGSKWLQALRDEPLVADELGNGGGVSVLSDQQRMFVERLELSGVESNSTRGTGSVKTVYYLSGDERRALRRFIKENESIVKNQLQHSANRFSNDWDEWLYGLLEEEFRFWLYK